MRPIEEDMLCLDCVADRLPGGIRMWFLASQKLETEE